MAMGYLHLAAVCQFGISRPRALERLVDEPPIPVTDTGR